MYISPKKKKMLGRLVSLPQIRCPSKKLLLSHTRKKKKQKKNKTISGTPDELRMNCLAAENNNMSSVSKTHNHFAERHGT